ncbi:MAG TPA: gas vesicle protein [Gaiellaceae bacterium]|nr:gas vesicle protein [Gaiellaceae bacterium]
MADLSESQRKRQEARKRRRKQPDDASSNDGADNASQDNEQLQHAVRQAAKGAAAAAAVGAAAAAARKLRSHDGDGQPEPQEQPEPEQEEPEAQEPETEAQQDSDPEPDDEEQQEPVAGAGGGETRRVLDRAREQLEDLLGRTVESVSSLERTHDGWVLSLEVVEVERIPETTDVLASYEMELDGDLNLRRYQRARRYIRSRSDDGDER